MNSSRRIIMALIFLLIIIMVGTIGYIIIENYSLLQGIYMAVITIATVGFSEVRPLSDSGQIFTIIYILVGFGSLAFVGHALAESLLENIWSDRLEIKRMKKKVSRLKSHYIICGVGRVGAAAAKHFQNSGVDFVIIETNPEYCKKVSEKGFLYVEGDATHEDVLLEAGIKSARGLLALLNSDPDNLFIVLTSRELNPTLHIIARSDETSSMKKIFQAGADSVVSPFASAGKQIASDILAITGRRGPASHSSKNAATPTWITIQDGSDMHNQTIAAVSEQIGREIVGLRRGEKDIIFPDPEIKLLSSDMILILERELENKNKQVQHSSERSKVVIIDDNPAILKLYTRLFQKAGFNPIPATNGREGLELILREKPAAAVIDFMLPLISGVDVCRQVRATKEGEETRLVMFTEDGQPKTRMRAIEAGADAVVVKSPEASEVINIVIQLLKGS